MGPTKAAPLEGFLLLLTFFFCVIDFFSGWPLHTKLSSSSFYNNLGLMKDLSEYVLFSLIILFQM